MVVQAIVYMAGWGMSNPSVTREIACASLSSRALRGTEPFKDCHRPQDQQEPCFQDEKALDDGVDLKLQQRGGKK